MKHIERNTYNNLRKNVTENTINVEIPVDYTHEGQQAIHELLTIEKGLYVTGINWNSIEECYCIHYDRAYTETAENIKREQEAADIDAITADMEYSDWTWNGYKKPDQEPVEAPQIADEIQTTDNTPAIMEAVEKAHQSRYSARQIAPLTFAIWDNVKNAPIIETTSNGIMAYIEIFGINRIDPAPAETIPATEAEPAPISDDERRAALDRLNREQNAANLFTNISPADVDSAVMMDRANATTTATAYSRPAYDWTQDNDTANATSGAGAPRTAQAG